MENEKKCAAGEEATAVAIHPSGFHIVVAFIDKVVFMNVFSPEIKEYSPSTVLSIKGCKELKFSNGGHMIAAGNTNGQIHVYNFYTLECMLTLLGHNNKIRCIDWKEDDTGFASCG
jgi:WD40 repeat protein